MKTKINEIFSSIQGEGLYAGHKQLFIRFCGCNLKCAYCDTEFEQGLDYTPQELFDKINSEYDLKTLHSISLTGGEPLLSADFLVEFLGIYGKLYSIPYVYLETNATLPDELVKVKPYIDIISADIKLKSATGIDTMIFHERFFENCKGIETFAKIVFDENITDDEIGKCTKLASRYGIPLVLQPKMDRDKMTVSSEFCADILDKFLSKNHNTRLIPQMHKFLKVR